MLRELSLFTGIGGGILASKLLGFIIVGACEIEPYCREVLLQRQKDGILEEFPIYDDIRTFDGYQWQGKCDLISGGFPCQSISFANSKGKGIAEGEKSGLWKEMSRVIGECRPDYVFIENVAAIISRGLNIVLQDLAEMGFDAEWCCLGADAFGVLKVD